MPRKRTTRLKPASKPEVTKAGNTVAQTERELLESQEQLDVYLNEFDYKVKCMQKEIENKRRAMLVLAQMAFNDLISHLDANERNMTVKEFVARRWNATEKTTKPVHELVQQFKWAESEGGLEAIAEDSSPAQTVGKGAKCTKKSTVKKTKAMPPPPSRRSKRSKCATPANFVRNSQYGQTPMVTPKFDPFVSTTPTNIRTAKPGERVMSITGSPILLDTKFRPGMAGKALDKDEITQELTGLKLSSHQMERVLKIISNN